MLYATIELPEPWSFKIVRQVRRAAWEARHGKTEEAVIHCQNMQEARLACEVAARDYPEIMFTVVSEKQ